MWPGTPVVHRCETVAATGDREVVHVVFPSRWPCGTPLPDLRDAGHDVLAYGVLPEEIGVSRLRRSLRV
jgi:hypothetical protein